MLIANHLIKVFEKNEKHNKKVSFRAVDDISLSVDKGEIVGIIGPNGAGKTTLLRMLGHLMEPTSGEVLYRDGDNEISDRLEIKRRIGYLSGNTRLYGRLSIRELLEVMGSIYGMTKAEISERIDYISDVLGLDTFIDNRIEKLSTGQTQRASISRCLIHNPDIYIFDEPTLGLDIVSSNSIIQFMKNERAKGKTVLYSTHYMEEAEILCDRIIMMNNGRIIRSGTVEALQNDTDGRNLREVFMNLIGEEDLGHE